MARFHVTTERVVTPATFDEAGNELTPESVTCNTTQVAFTTDEEAAADLAAVPSEADCTLVIQGVIDATAKAKSYSDGVSCASYRDSTNTAWASEATTFVHWRDNVWGYAYNLLGQVQAGQAPMPTLDQLISGLPAITWP